MTELEALKLVFKKAEGVWLSPHAEDDPGFAEALDQTKALIGRVEHAESTPDGASDLALEVLKERGFEVYLAKKGASPFLRRFLDVSTGHLTQHTRSLLGSYDDALCGVVKVDVPFGWWVWATEDQEILAAFPEDLQAVITFARKWEAEWIKLDCDAEPVEGLPHYGGEA
jgi:hypothetical protein